MLSGSIRRGRVWWPTPSLQVWMTWHVPRIISWERSKRRIFTLWVILGSLFNDLGHRRRNNLSGFTSDIMLARLIKQTPVWFHFILESSLQPALTARATRGQQDLLAAALRSNAIPPRRDRTGVVPRCLGTRLLRVSADNISSTETIGRKGGLIQEKVDYLLMKWANEPVRDRNRGFYLNLILVKKTEGSLRPVIKIRGLSCYYQVNYIIQDVHHQRRLRKYSIRRLGLYDSLTGHLLHLPITK